MIERTSILREPIKIRKAIVRDFCSCWGMKVLSVDGLPHLLIADGVPDINIGGFLNSVDDCIGFYISEDEEVGMSKVRMLAGFGLPVMYGIRDCISMEMVETLSIVAHSSIQINANSDSWVIPWELRETLAYAKDYKVSSMLNLEYLPHLTKRLDLYENLEKVRNIVKHVVVHFPVVPDDEFNQKKPTWEDECQGSVALFKHYYMPDVPSRSWVIKPRYQQELISELREFLSLRKITLEVVGDQLVTEARVKTADQGYSKYPMGMRSFFYTKEGVNFVQTNDYPTSVCSKCGKSIFM